MDRGPLELLEELLEITLRMRNAVSLGELESLSEYLSSRQKLIDVLGPFLKERTLGATERLRALALLGEIAKKDEEIRSRLEEILKRELSSLREEYRVVKAAKTFRKSIEPPSSPRFLEEEG